MKNFLLLDIGNTAIDLMNVENKRKQKVEKFLIKDIKKFFKYIDKHIKNIEKIYISSVNKNTLNKVIKYFEDNKKEFEILDYKKEEEFVTKNKYDIPNLKILGGDLFCDLVNYDKTNRIIIDLGTVSKIMAINKENKFLGGMIFPGLNSFDKVITATTEIKNIDSKFNSLPLLNYDTQDCINSGTINGTTLLIISVVEKIKDDYNLLDASVILTGGNSKYLIETFVKNKKNYQYEPSLVLNGLAIIYDLEIKKR